MCWTTSKLSATVLTTLRKTAFFLLRMKGMLSIIYAKRLQKRGRSLSVPIPGWIYSAFSSDSAAQEEVVLLTLQEILPVPLPASSGTPDWFHFWFNQCPSFYKKWQEDLKRVCEDGTEPPGFQFDLLTNEESNDPALFNQFHQQVRMSISSWRSPSCLWFNFSGVTRCHFAGGLGKICAWSNVSSAYRAQQKKFYEWCFHGIIWGKTSHFIFDRYFH